MTKIICIANPAKGMGRTMSSVNLAASLALLEKKVLIVDCDPEKGTSAFWGFTYDNYDYGLDDLLTGFVGGKGVVSKTSLEYLDIIPAGHGLDEIEENLFYNPDKEKVLEIIIKKFREDYEFILFDTPGDSGLLTKSALIASDEIFIPLKCDSHVSENMARLISLLNEIHEKFDATVQMGGLILTFCDNESKMNALQSGSFKGFEEVIFQTTIPVSYKKEINREPACLVDIRSDIAVSYLDAAYELLSR